VIPPSGEQLEIAFGSQRAVVVEAGGGLRTYVAGGRDILDGYGEDQMCTSGRGQVLIPWPNRIEDGSYELDGRRHQLPLNEPDRRNAIHGLARWAAWTVGERAPHRVVMQHVLRPQPGYPFSLALSAEYRLSDRGLTVRTKASNVGPQRCPYGAGAHPYLTVGTETVDTVTLEVPARMVLHCDDRGIPTAARDVEGTEFDFRRPKTIGRTVLDHAFTELERDANGVARVKLTAPDGRALALWVDAGYPYLMLFTGDPLPDVNRRSLAVEPMTCPPNAFRSGDGLIVLEPGGSFTTGWGIDPLASQ